jgi:hypothetical protein
MPFGLIMMSTGLPKAFPSFVSQPVAKSFTPKYFPAASSL